MGLSSGGLIIGGLFANEILFFFLGGAGILGWGSLIIGILGVFCHRRHFSYSPAYRVSEIKIISDKCLPGNIALKS